jgi:hypothetical protein
MFFGKFNSNICDSSIQCYQQKTQIISGKIQTSVIISFSIIDKQHNKRFQIVIQEVEIAMTLLVARLSENKKNYNGDHNV